MSEKKAPPAADPVLLLLEAVRLQLQALAAQGRGERPQLVTALEGKSNELAARALPIEEETDG